MDGLLHVFVPHATAGLAIIETSAGSDDDLLAAAQRPAAAEPARASTATAPPGHSRYHVMPTIVPPHCSVPVLGGRLALGTWQSICLVDLNVDNAEPRGALVLPGAV